VRFLDIASSHHDSPLSSFFLVDQLVDTHSRIPSLSNIADTTILSRTLLYEVIHDTHTFSYRLFIDDIFIFTCFVDFMYRL